MTDPDPQPNDDEEEVVRAFPPEHDGLTATDASVLIDKVIAG